jgi:hypothetical protein
MAEASSNPTDKNYWTQQMYEAFPQLVPHTSLTMRFRLEGDVSGSGSKTWMLSAWICFFAGIIVSIVLYYLKRSGNIRKMHPVVVYLPFLGMTIMFVVFLCTAHGVRKINPRGAIIDGLEDCNISITNDIDVPVVEFSSEQNGDAIEIDYVVRKAASSEEITSGILRVPMDKIDDGGKLFAYRLFGIKKKEIGEEPDEVIVADKKDTVKK